MGEYKGGWAEEEDQEQGGRADGRWETALATSRAMCSAGTLVRGLSPGPDWAPSAALPAFPLVGCSPWPGRNPSASGLFQVAFHQKRDRRPQIPSLPSPIVLCLLSSLSLSTQLAPFQSQNTQTLTATHVSCLRLISAARKEVPLVLSLHPSSQKPTIRTLPFCPRAPSFFSAAVCSAYK